MPRLMKKGLHKTGLLLGCLLVASLVSAQANPPKALPLAQDPREIIKFLTKIVSWHRQLASEQQIAQASDSTAVQENRRVADQVVQLAFEYGRSQAVLQAKQPLTPATPVPQADGDTEYQALAQAAQQADKDVTDTEAELQSVLAKLASASAPDKDILRSQAGELQGELGLLR